ncbi:MAG: cytochrome c peroxidase, partial [Opitutaceae bacterium]
MSFPSRFLGRLAVPCLLACRLLGQAEQVALEPVDPVVARFAANEPLDVAPDIPLEPRKLSLRRLPAPRPSNLADFIADEKAAIVLGKALFWDMQLGSDGVQACASCHFHAGADNRSRAQLSPGLLISDASGAAKPDRTLRNATMAHQLSVTDFPFRKLANPEDRASAVLADSNDVAGSQGVRAALYAGLESANGVVSEKSAAVPDDVFNYGGRNTRRVTPRNAPTVINAVYNVRNFWDGRAQNTFNGVNPWGLRDAK